MMQLATSTLDVIISRKPDELIGAFMLALILSFAAAKIFTRIRREAADGLATLVGLILVVSLTSLALAAGYVAEGRRRANMSRPPEGARLPDNAMPGAYGPGMALGPAIFRLLDGDNDGRVTPREASTSVERFIRDSGRSEKGELDLVGMLMIVNQRVPAGPGAPVGSMAPPRVMPPTAPPEPSSPEAVARLIAESTSSLIFESADADRDGSLSPEEAAASASSFIRAVEAEHGRSLDRAALGDSLRKNLLPRSATATSTATARPEPPPSRRPVGDDPSPP